MNVPPARILLHGLFVKPLSSLGTVTAASGHHLPGPTPCFPGPGLPWASSDLRCPLLSSSDEVRWLCALSAGGGKQSREGSVEHATGFWKVLLLSGSGVECPPGEQTQHFWNGPGTGRGWAVTKNRPGSILGHPRKVLVWSRVGRHFPDLIQRLFSFASPTPPPARSGPPRRLFCH